MISAAAIVSQAMPGAAMIRPGLDFGEYLAIEAEHSTALKYVLTSPLLYKWRKDHPREDSDMFAGGRAGHTAILEPDRFLLDYVLWPEKNGRRYGTKWDAFSDANAGRTILKEEQYRTCLLMRDAARAHPAASKLLTEHGQNELSIQWTDERTGLRCKARIDRLCSALVDVKTCRDPDPRLFAAQAARLGYAMQLAFYREAVRAAGLGDKPVQIIAVQNVEPYDVVVFELPEDLLAHGSDQYKGALDKLIECRKTDTWPGIADDVRPLLLPAWAAPAFDEASIDFGTETIS